MNSYYHKLILRNIDFQKPQMITEEDIINITDKCYRKCAFSIFPYIYNSQNSRDSIETSNSGDCVSLSIFIQKTLKHIGFISYLIPATIPNKYKLPGYLDISHVALLIPGPSVDQYFVIDPAFYFLHPMKVNLTQSSNLIQSIFSKNIYMTDTELDLHKMKSIDIIEYQLLYSREKKLFNKYQTIPQDTFYINCWYEKDSSDKWQYFLTEIINPDMAITTFFINIKKTPFITTTQTDRHGIPCLDAFLQIDNHQIKLKLSSGKTQYYDLYNLSQENISTINSYCKKYIGDIREYIKSYNSNIIVYDYIDKSS